MQRITVAVDGSPGAERALDLALALARGMHAKLSIVAVVPFHPSMYPAPYTGLVPPAVSEAEVEGYRSMLERFRAKALAAEIDEVKTELRQGIVVDEILDQLRGDRPDLLVVGSRGLSATKRLLLGSVSEALVHHAPCPVLVDRPAE
jgi:nucleotide-binding universal stress UspA family protein